MASHRRHRKPGVPLASRATKTATGATIAAIATLSTTMAQPTQADDKPTLRETKDRVDRLYRQAEVATQRYNAAKEKTGKLQRQVDRLQDKVAEKTGAQESTREKIGKLAAAQYRNGGVSEVMQLALSDSPEDYLTGRDLMEQVSSSQKTLLSRYATARADTEKDRRKAAGKLGELTTAQRKLAGEKTTVQSKLREARRLLSRLTAEEKAKLAAEEKAKREAAQKRADEIARKERETKAKEAAAAAEKKKDADAAKDDNKDDAGSTPDKDTDTTPDKPSGDGGSGSSATTAAEKAIAFARSKIGLPYIWGGTGPKGYDCSGLTQGAWKAAGISLPRTTWDQVKSGKSVSKSELKPGDLIFFYDDISHVGLYIGGGQMIHAPKPGADITTAPITWMPWHSARRVT